MRRVILMVMLFCGGLWAEDARYYYEPATTQLAGQSTLYGVNIYIGTDNLNVDSFDVVMVVEIETGVRTYRGHVDRMIGGKDPMYPTVCVLWMAFSPASQILSLEVQANSVARVSRPSPFVRYGGIAGGRQFKSASER